MRSEARSPTRPRQKPHGTTYAPQPPDYPHTQNFHPKLKTRSGSAGKHAGATSRCGLLTTNPHHHHNQQHPINPQHTTSLQNNPRAYGSRPARSPQNMRSEARSPTRPRQKPHGHHIHATATNAHKPETSTRNLKPKQAPPGATRHHIRSHTGACGLALGNCRRRRTQDALSSRGGEQAEYCP